MSAIRVPLENFKDEIASLTELSSVALGGQVVSVSDEFFAGAFHLLLAEPAPSLKGTFGPNGALYSGWETRRHNPAYDWCIIKLGAPGSIYAFDIDTSHFNGNEAPEVSVEGLFSDGDPSATDKRWTEILPKVPLGPNSRHLFKLVGVPEGTQYNYVKLNMYPDGGIARSRVYGIVNPVFPEDSSQLLDLAHVFAGGRAVFTSDQHFGAGSNLLLPGRGKDMGDGWETKRSRVKGHKDWVIIKLGAPGVLEHVKIDTIHFKGNFPESCEIHACYSEKVVPDIVEGEWTQILSRHKLGPHRQHHFQLENVHENVYTHVRVTMFPDGGMKRVCIFGRLQKAPPVATQTRLLSPASIRELEPSPPLINGTPANAAHVNGSYTPTKPVSSQQKAPEIVTALPLTTEAFAPFGQVLMAWKEPTAAPRGVKVTSANQGTAHKFHLLSQVQSSYPSDRTVRTGFSVYRSSPAGAKFGEYWPMKLLERHSCTNQAFIPMGSSGGSQEDELTHTGKAYLVIVALNGQDDKPDLQTLRAFVATTSQGIVYNTGIWHHPMITLEDSIDFTCVETQIGDGDKLDCEILEFNGSQTVFVPAF
ncbi:hypothetical protein M422DRAFT_246721 [Sphaerobolus stellatus SS14]|nr:hypothetical protein M422DRAFT_246721 [Sphaerobolus stellatus SS14]